MASRSAQQLVRKSDTLKSGVPLTEINKGNAKFNPAASPVTPTVNQTTQTPSSGITYSGNPINPFSNIQTTTSTFGQNQYDAFNKPDTGYASIGAYKPNENSVVPAVVPAITPVKVGQNWVYNGISYGSGTPNTPESASMHNTMTNYPVTPTGSASQTIAPVAAPTVDPVIAQTVSPYQSFPNNAPGSNGVSAGTGYMYNAAQMDQLSGQTARWDDAAGWNDTAIADYSNAGAGASKALGSGGSAWNPSNWTGSGIAEGLDIGFKGLAAYGAFMGGNAAQQNANTMRDQIGKQNMIARATAQQGLEDRDYRANAKLGLSGAESRTNARASNTASMARYGIV